MTPDSGRGMSCRPKLVAALAVVGLSAVLFISGGEGILRFELQRYADFANPVYVFAVLAFLLSFAVGSYILIWIVQTVNRER